MSFEESRCGTIWEGFSSIRQLGFDFLAKRKTDFKIGYDFFEKKRIGFDFSTDKYIDFYS